MATLEMFAVNCLRRYDLYFAKGIEPTPETLIVDVIEFWPEKLTKPEINRVKDLLRRFFDSSHYDQDRERRRLERSCRSVNT